MIFRDGKPLAELKPAQGGELRPYALAAGEFVVPDDFDDPIWFEFSVTQAIRRIEDKDEPVYTIENLKEKI